MDRFFVELDNIDCENKKLKITGEDVKHITKVLRYKIDDKIEVCDGNNNEYICSIEDIGREEILCNILENVDIKRESNVRVRLYQGLPKNTKMEIILQKLTECGVDEIILVDTDRSVVSIDEKKSDKKLQRWERIIYEASKQSKRGIIPRLRGVISFDEALKDMEDNDLNISPYESEKTLGISKVLKEYKANIHQKSDSIKVGIFVGPEGGFTEEENNKIKNTGAYSVSLGPRIFRTETASIVATSIVLYELGDIGGDN